MRYFMSSRLMAAGLAAVMAVAVLATPVRAQEAVTKETAAAVKASFLADLDTLKTKFVGLAEAIPQDKYTWRPMEGVRSVSEVLMLAAMEGYSFIPNGFGGKPQALGTPEEVARLRALTDKAQVIDHLNKGFAYAKAQIDAADPAALTGKRRMMGRELSVVEVATFIGGDLHEHLGQMIAYARQNRVVPPWSK